MPTPAPAAPQPVTPARPAVPKIYELSDPDVKPPTTISQSMPIYPTRPVPVGRGTLEIVIDETGIVESAVMRGSINSLYDTLAVTATRGWRYKPATVNGVPVKFRKNIIITLKPVN
jgi:TonB family protein